MSSAVRRVISFSLWGGVAGPRYAVGAVRNAELAPEIYPGWECWIHHPVQPGWAAPAQLERLTALPHVRLIAVDEPPDWRASFWRFQAAIHPDVGVMISRDADSRLNLRERAAVDEWLAAGAAFHVMHDHPYHTDPILAGMWGICPGTAPAFGAALRQWPREDFYGTDQAFLARTILPLARSSGVFHHAFDPRARPFPTPRRGLEFVGQQFDEHDWPVFAHSIRLAGALWRAEVTTGAAPA